MKLINGSTKLFLIICWVLLCVSCEVVGVSGLTIESESGAIYMPSLLTLDTPASDRGTHANFLDPGIDVVEPTPFLTLSRINAHFLVFW